MLLAHSSEADVAVFSYRLPSIELTATRI